MNLVLCLVLSGISIHASATDEVEKGMSFNQILSQREKFNEKHIQIEGKVKDLKMIKEEDKKFATFFLTDAVNPEITISVKVNLSKRKKEINTFTCKEGEFTTVEVTCPHCLYQLN